MNALRLAVGTLTALPVRPPTHVDARTARAAVLLAPLAALPLGTAVAAVLWASYWLEFNALASGLAAVGALALGTRAFHLDGLADTADGLTASYDRERSLAVMKTGGVGPAGTAALFLVMGIQAIGFASLTIYPLVAGFLVCLSRSVLALTCLRGIPAAEGDGLRTPFAGCVPLPLAVAAVAVAGSAAVVVFAWYDLGWQNAFTGFALATVAVLLLLRRAVKRLGGVTGDIYGASIELTLAALLVTV